MATRKPRRTSKLDEEPYASKTRETNQMVDELLARYGKPTMSLEQLREEVAL